MSNEIDGLAAVVAPEVGIPLKFAKWALWGLAGLLVAVFAGWVLWKLFFAERAAQAEHDKVQAETQVLVGKAEGNAGAAAANIVAGTSTKETIIHDTTRTNTIEITKQPGASDPVSDAVDAAGRRAICLRTVAASLPDCQRLQKANP